MTEEEVNDRIGEFEAKRNTRILQALLGLIGVLIVVSFNFWYTYHTQRTSDQRWCEMFVGIDDNYRATPPSKLTGQQLKFAGQVHTLRQELHCKATVVHVTPVSPSVSPSGK